MSESSENKPNQFPLGLLAIGFFMSIASLGFIAFLGYLCWVIYVLLGHFGMI